MTHVFFHCANAKLVTRDHVGRTWKTWLRRTSVPYKLFGYVNTLSPDDWRAWTLHVATKTAKRYS